MITETVQPQHITVTRTQRKLTRLFSLSHFEWMLFLTFPVFKGQTYSCVKQAVLLKIAQMEKFCLYVNCSASILFFFLN